MAQAAPCLSAIIAFAICLSAVTTLAEPANTNTKTAENLNTSPLTVISGDFAGPLRWMADDLATVINGEDKLHILPVFGVGGDNVVQDALYLKSMDVGFVHSDLLAQEKLRGGNGHDEKYMRFIANLYVKEVGIIAGKSIKNIRDLAGKKVSFDYTTSSNYATSTLIFDLLGINVENVQVTHAQAIEKIKSGEIAAIVLVDDKPNKTIATLRSEDGLRLVPIELTDELNGVYLPIVVTSDDYPDLIATGQSVDTIGVNVVMAMYRKAPNSVRYARIAQFVQAFFSKFNKLQDASRHPNWQQVNIAAPLPGWTRFKPAEEWLTKNGDPAHGDGAMSRLRFAFQKFVDRQAAATGKGLTEAQKQNLFREFLSWKSNPEKATIRVHMTAIDGVGKPIGTISVRNIKIEIAGNSELALLLKPDLMNLPPGPHALHIHTNPSCGSGKKDGELVAGLGAGGHLFLTREGKTYGNHLGDLPDLIAAEDGTAKETIVVSRLNMADLLDRSIMIHASGSDTSSRLACGAIQ